MRDKILSITQCAVHVFVLLVSLYIIVPMVTHMSDFRGHCALFSCGDYDENDGHFQPQWSFSGFCVYSILVGFFIFISGLSQLLLKLRLLYKNHDCTFLHAFLDFFVDILLTVLIAFNALNVTAGLYKWCRCVMERFDSCSTAASVMQFSANSTIVANDFAYQLNFVQFGAWSLLVGIVFQLMLSSRKVFMIHESQNLAAAMSFARRQYHQTID